VQLQRSKKMTDTPGELLGRSLFSPSLLQQTSGRYASGQLAFTKLFTFYFSTRTVQYLDLTIPGIVFIGRQPFYKALAWPTVLAG
jgi:hypothetical protein